MNPCSYRLIWDQASLIFIVLWALHCKCVPPSFTVSLLGRENLIHSDVEVMFYVEQGLTVLFPSLFYSVLFTDWTLAGCMYHRAVVGSHFLMTIFQGLVSAKGRGVNLSRRRVIGRGMPGCYITWNCFSTRGTKRRAICSKTKGVFSCESGTSLACATAEARTCASSIAGAFSTEKWTHQPGESSPQTMRAHRSMSGVCF